MKRSLIPKILKLKEKHDEVYYVFDTEEERNSIRQIFTCKSQLKNFCKSLHILHCNLPQLQEADQKSILHGLCCALETTVMKHLKLSNQQRFNVYNV